MNISQLIEELEIARSHYGDMPLATWRGLVSRVRFTPTKDAILYPVQLGDHNEVNVEFLINGGLA